MEVHGDNEPTFFTLCSQVKDEAQDFFFLSKESQKKLDERRRVVLSRRYALKTDTEEQARQDVLTKPPVVRITLDGFQSLKRKTRNVLQKDAEKSEVSRSNLFLILYSSRAQCSPASNRNTVQNTMFENTVSSFMNVDLFEFRCRRDLLH